MKEIALSDLLKRLGYKYHGPLANKIRDLLKEKENFKKFIVGGKKGYGRDEKFIVTTDATTLVDNLAILEPYVKLFGIADSRSQYTPLHSLKDPKQRSNLKLDASKFEAKLRKDLERSETALKQLPRFIQCLSNAKEIDITKDSLRELINSTQNTMPVDVSGTFETTIWNDIVELKAEIEAGSDSSLNNQKLGENWYLLGEFDDAFEHLERAIELNPENGIAHVILSLIYLKQLEAIDPGLQPNLESYDYPGYFENPLDAEDAWESECSAAGMEDFLTLRSKLMHCMIKGLYFWPEHSFKSSLSRKNYVSTLNFTFESQLEINRIELFRNFLKYLSYSDFLAQPDLVEKIAVGVFCSSYGDWQLGDSCVSNSQIVKAIILTNWFSPDGAKQLILNDIGSTTQLKTIISYRFSLYSDHVFTSLYRHLFGRQKYEMFINDALFHLQHVQLTENLAMLAMDRLDAIYGCLNKLELHYCYKSEESYMTSSLKQFELSDVEVKVNFDKIFQQIYEWQNLLQHNAWKNLSPTDSSFTDVEVLIVIACLLEFSHGSHSERNVAILEELFQRKPYFSLGILRADYYLARELVLRAKACNSALQQDNVNRMIEAYSSAVELRRQQEFDDAFY